MYMIFYSRIYSICEALAFDTQNYTILCLSIIILLWGIYIGDATHNGALIHLSQQGSIK